jgi:hypothetical protein
VLQTQAKNDALLKETFERESMKVSDEVKDHIEGLKNSFVNNFNSLSEIMLEEFEAIRNEQQINVGNNNYCPMHRTVEHLTLLSAKSENDITQLAKRQEYLEQRFESIPQNDYTQTIDSLNVQVQTSKEDYKSLYDQMGDIICNLNDEVALLKSDHLNYTQSIDTMKRNISDLNQSFKFSSKK